jgi:uncharacterized protein (DUF697 family)
MTSPRQVLHDLWENLRAPKVSDDRLEEYLQKVRQELPAPVFWLLGKAQSGKTSLIRALTGSTRAEIGNGFRPCTLRSQLYPFPGESDCFLHFLDTRGLGEVDYDPAEDVRVLENQAHCLIVVVKAMDHAQQCVLEPLAKIFGSHPSWPLIVVQTSLHEGYPSPATRHVAPYPYGEDPLPPSVPQDLARSLATQRQWFEGCRARFVPVDFTLPEDGFDPEHYGLDALWEAIEEAVPLGLRGILQETQEARRPLRDMYFDTAHPQVIWHALAAGAAGGVPVPLVDIPLFVAIQVKQFHAIASIYGQEMSVQRMTEVLGTLGIGLITRLGGRELLKVIPGFGSAVSALFAAASTYALGCTLCVYFSRVRDGDVPDAAFLRKLYKDQYREGRQRLSGYLGHLTQGKEAPR